MTARIELRHEANPVSARRAGLAITALPVLFLIFDISIKFSGIQPVADSMHRLGIPLHLTAAVGMLELACLVLFLVPRTTVLGLLLLTGFLGGAVAIHVRVGDPLFTHVLFPGYVAALAWLGLYLREPRLRSLLPLR